MRKQIVRLILAVAGCGALCGGTLSAQNKPVYQDETQPIESRVEDALKRMTVEEKIGLLHANGGYTSGGVPRLGIVCIRPWIELHHHRLRQNQA